MSPSGSWGGEKGEVGGCAERGKLSDEAAYVSGGRQAGIKNG